MIRPSLRRGDIVKLSNKGKKYSRTFNTNTPMIVINIEGNGADRSSIIQCRIKTEYKYEYHTFYRSELWKTGENVFK